MLPTVRYAVIRNTNIGLNQGFYQFQSGKLAERTHDTSSDQGHQYLRYGFGTGWVTD
jgi:hypothetical protein